MPGDDTRKSWSTSAVADVIDGEPRSEGEEGAIVSVQV